MKVMDLIELLSKCNPEADITSYECRFFEKHLYYPITLDYYKIDDDNILNQKEAQCNDANVVLIR